MRKNVDSRRLRIITACRSVDFDLNQLSVSGILSDYWRVCRSICRFNAASAMGVEVDCAGGGSA
ncbi:MULTISPECIES: hypothetical protein [Burkholderia]|uniref:hypothetical protein n=1 Tax=Burkholderia TaxID=32008 RepID=UPI001E603980|nr:MULTISPECIES: hypothetical protein [unclassified Burkholderia]UEP29898.1 hypothetical protein LMA01_26140 [Burkholderia sp. B21-007]UEP44790.1 hypothetical protein LMA02_18640 [Burkholderia sp. B21-005]